MIEPPRDVGAVHVRATCASPEVASKPVGAPGVAPAFGVPATDEVNELLPLILATLT